MKKGFLHKIYTLTVAIATMFMGYSCSQEDYKYTPDNACVTFQNAPAKGYELNGDPIEVQIMRGVTNTSETINLSFNGGDTYSIDQTSVSFAPGEHTKVLTVTYEKDELKAFTEYTFEISFDNKLVSPTGKSTFKGSGMPPFSLDALDYLPYGKVWCDCSMWGSGYDWDGRTYELELANHTKNYYKIKNFFGGGVDLTFIMYPEGNIEIHTLEPEMPPAFVNNYEMYKIPTDLTFEGEPVTLWIDTDDYWQYKDFGEGDYPFVVDSYFGNYALWSTPTRLLTSVETRGDSSDDGWWRLYWNIGTIY